MSVSSSIWTDWDADGDHDLLVLGTTGSVAYRNTGSRFVRTSLSGITGLSWYAGAWGDYNSNGRQDLALVAENSLAIFARRRGTFQRVYGIGLSAGRAVAWMDVDNDGDLDLFVVRGRSGGTNQSDFFLLRDGGTFKPFLRDSFAGPRRGDGDSVSVADVDRDGRVDMMVSNGNWNARGRTTLLRNKTAAGNWLLLDPRGGDKNPSGFGARVRVRTKNRILRRYVTDGVGFRGQSEAAVHLGLRGGKRASVRVVWPLGQRDCLSTPANVVVRVKIGKHPWN